MEKPFSEQDSIKLINEMITQARDNIQIGSATTMIFSGYCVSAIALLDIILLQVLDNPNMANWVWTLTLPMGIISLLINRRKDKSAIVRTPIDRVIRKVWQGFSISVVVCLSFIFMSVYIFKSWIPCAFITPVLLLLVGLAQFITGHSTRFKPFIYGAYAFWLGALLTNLLSYKVFQNEGVQFAILIICMLIGFIVPGHTLNRKAKENV